MTVLERFLRYVQIHTTSDEDSQSSPSTERQLKLAALLCEELKEMGLADATLDEYGYVYATLPKNTHTPCNDIGFIAHLDTSDAASGDGIRPRVVEYTGEDILLNPERNIFLRESDYPCLKKYRAKHLVVTDGNTLLGADDKAGIAEIMSALDELIRSGAKHGKISVAFTPDEEIGRGADRFDVKKFGAEYAYTVDGGAIGEVEYENFNAASAVVTLHGISIHPGAAKGKMKNAAHIACEFNSLLPTEERPELTEGYEGFHHLLSINAETELATLKYIIRDHDKALFEKKKRDFENARDIIREKYGEDSIEVLIEDSYYNMREKIEKNLFIVERAVDAMRECGIEPIKVPIRGGTDGSRLSFMGLPTPNLCTGGENFHSRFEFASVEDMEKITELIVKIATNAATQGKKPVYV